MKKKIIYIYPEPSKKNLRFDQLANSLRDKFDLRILVKGEQDILFDGIFKLNDFYCHDYNSNFVNKFPFSIIGVDRGIVDYSNGGSQTKKFNKSDYEKTLLFFKYHFESFKPDYIFTHASDNSFCHMATLVSKELKIQCFIELLRPYWPTRQILVDPFTFDSLQVKNLASKYFDEHIVNADALKQRRDDFDYQSPYWTGNFPTIKNIINRGFIAKILNIYSYQKLARKIYSKLFIKNNITTNKYIFFPLHLQPEAVLLATDNRFSDQASLCQFISYNIPLDYSLIVKEHPAQNFRTIFFYRKIANLPNTSILSKESSTENLIKGSSVVVVISGNAGYEALLSGKKVILLDDAYYSEFPNVHKFKYDMRFDVFIRKIIECELTPISIVMQYADSYASALYELSIYVSPQDLNNNVVDTAGKRLNDLLTLHEDNVN